MPPPHLMHRPGMPPTMMPPPGMMMPPPRPGGSMILPPSGMNPNVLSAPPSIMRPGAGGHMTDPSRGLLEDVDMSIGGIKKKGPTIEAKAQIKHVIGDSTKFMPTALRVKREMKDSKGHIIKQSRMSETTLCSFCQLLSS